MNLYERMSDKSVVKLYWIARHCGDFTTANDILQVLKQRNRPEVRWKKGEQMAA